jgi:hypothetical protein
MTTLRCFACAIICRLFRDPRRRPDIQLTAGPNYGLSRAIGSINAIVSGARRWGCVCTGTRDFNRKNPREQPKTLSVPT